MDGQSPEEPVVTEKEVTTQAQEQNNQSQPIDKPPRPSFMQDERGSNKSVWGAILGFFSLAGLVMGVAQNENNRTPPDFLNKPSIGGEPTKPLTDAQKQSAEMIKGIGDDIAANNEKQLAEALERHKSLINQNPNAKK